jgi:hypothetical protein
VLKPVRAVAVGRYPQPEEKAMSRRPGLLAVVGLLSMTLSQPVSAVAQDAEEIINTAIERYEQRMAGVENYTLVQEVMGFETTSYFERQTVDGRTVYRMVDAYTDDSRDNMGEMYNGFLEVADRAKYSGNEKVEGHDTYVLAVDDFSGLAFAGEDDDFKPKKGLFYLDASEYVIRRIEMEGTVERDGKSQPATADMYFEDYRSVDGMLHPFLIQMNISGVTSGMSEEELEEARKDLEEMRKQMDEMSESQRKMMESMMGPQIEKYEEMLNSGNFEISITIKELQVNQGPPK